MNLILNRKGTCTTRFTSTNQCKSVGHKVYNYTVRLTCEPKLDKDKFLIDHEHVDKACKSVFDCGISSCEELIMRMCDSVSKACRKHKTILKRIYIKLWPEDPNVMAFMELDKEF
jgi:hypothetical protein